MTKLDPRALERAIFEHRRIAANGNPFEPTYTAEDCIAMSAAIAAYLDALPSAAAPKPPVGDWFKRKAALEGDLEVSAGWKHVKRGTTYDVIGDAELQSGRALEEGVILCVYLCRETGRLWARPSDEFHDGRFKPIPAAPKGRETE